MKKGELGKCRGMFGDVVVRRLYRLTDGSVACGDERDQAKGSRPRNPKAQPSDNGLLSGGCTVGLMLKSVVATMPIEPKALKSKGTGFRFLGKKKQLNSENFFVHLTQFLI
jgi:hypothetical protein